MDPDVAVMLADLGAQRRDVVSAPNENRGRKTRYEEAAILRQEEERKKKVLLGEGGDDDKVSVLRKWNTKATFGVDEVYESLENRYNGQGHRAALAAKFSSDRGYEEYHEGDNHYGEERRPYNRDRHANGPPPSHNIFGDRSGRPRHNDRRNNDFSDRTGRAPANNNSFPGLARTADPNHQRAPSPRSFGTVRFEARKNIAGMPHSGTLGPQSSIMVLPTTLHPLRSAPTAALHSDQPLFSGFKPEAAATAATEPPVVAAATTPAPPVGNAPGPFFPATNAIAQLRANDAAASGRPDSISAPASAPEPAPVTTPASTPTKTISHENNILAEKSMKLGIWYAANPGPEADRCYTKVYPERLPYLLEARRILARDAVQLVANANVEEDRKDRVWIYEAAIKARSGELTDYAGNPMFEEVVKATNELFEKEGCPPIVQSKPIMDRKDSVIEPAKEETPLSSRASSRSSAPSASTISSAPTPARNSGKPGMLAATYYDIDGNFLGNKQYRIDAPVHANIIVTSKLRRCDPRQLADAMEAIGKEMIDRSRGLPGVRRTTDGVWEEEDLEDLL